MYDPRLTWNTQEVVDAAGGVAVRCKSGHAFMKECMRANEVLYGGEMSAHHYFKDFSYCDSGMIPMAVGGGAVMHQRQNFVGAGRSTDGKISLQRRDQPQG